MWDMKPTGPVEIRGEFNPISTSLPGVTRLRTSAAVVEADAPRDARAVDESQRQQLARRGRLRGADRTRPRRARRRSQADRPSVARCGTRQVATSARRVLPYVTLPYKTKEGAGGPLQPGFLAGFMGAGYDPFWVLDDPNSPNFQVRNLSLPAGVAPNAMKHRSGLLSALDRGLGRERTEPAHRDGRFSAAGVRPAHVQQRPAGIPA